MAVHDWTQVEAGIFHDFHVAWVPEIRRALNEGLLPEGYYALAEQHAGDSIADVLALHATAAPPESDRPLPPLTTSGGTAVADAPPRVRRRETINPRGHARTVAIRHVSGHRLVALIEVVSPANKDRLEHVLAFAQKAASALSRGIHVLMVDLFPPGRHDTEGMHGAIRDLLGNVEGEEDERAPGDEPLTLAAYRGGRPTDAFIEPIAVGATLPDMPLFIIPDRYINVPLEATYRSAYRGMPAFWRDVLEGRRAAP